jgi:hypothetical protein
MTRRQALTTLAAIALTAAACGNPNRPDVTVTIQDKTTGQPICDAQVTAVSGSYVETLKPNAFPTTECFYTGAGERAGVYNLTVTKDGFAPATRAAVKVDEDYCHVIPVRLTIALDR